MCHEQRAMAFAQLSVEKEHHNRRRRRQTKKIADRRGGASNVREYGWDF